jgi:flavin-dependent dehydrogenase
MMNAATLTSDSALLNNDAEKHYDVVVIGSGPIGIFYAATLKKMRPQTTIAVLDRKGKPGHKVGESTLGTTVRAFRAMGLSLPMMQRLFGTKAGLRFFNTHPGTDQLEKEVDVTDIEETFQVERRVLEVALHETARRRGIDILKETTLMPKASTFSANGNRLLCKTATGENLTIHCQLVADASGPASVLPKHFGVYRKDMELYDTFNYNAYYGYFKLKKEVPLRFWEYPATRHITFPGGWLWFITLTSWEKTKDENLSKMVKSLLDRADNGDADESYPTRNQLEAEYGAESEQTISVGFAIRTDRDTAEGSIGDRFMHYVKQHPAIDWLMEHYELVEQPYQEHNSPWFTVAHMAHDVTQAAGDGWCAIGDAALFSNPIFSPGMTLGTGTSYMAACDSAAGLDSGNLNRATFANYEEYARTLIDTLLDDTDMLYRSFEHPDSYERVLAYKFFTGVPDIIDRDEYEATDPYVWKFLSPESRKYTKDIKAIFREGERTGKSPAVMAQEVSALVTPYVAEVCARPEIAALRVNRFFNFYDDRGLYGEKLQKERGTIEFTRCSCCKLFVNDALPSCSNCGKIIHNTSLSSFSSQIKDSASLAALHHRQTFYEGSDKVQAGVESNTMVST